MTPVEECVGLLRKLGVRSAGDLASFSPIDGQEIGRVETGKPEAACARAAEAFPKWRSVPAPRRGELVRLLGEDLRAAKDDLARLYAETKPEVIGFDHDGLVLRGVEQVDRIPLRRGLQDPGASPR